MDGYNIIFAWPELSAAKDVKLEDARDLLDQMYLGLTVSELSAQMTAACFYPRIVLADLAGRYRLGVVSNFYGNLATVCNDLGLRPHLNVMVDSTDLGWTKPDPRLFRHALDALGVDPARAVFVGDSLSRDMAGARAVGMAHIWLVGDAAPLPDPCCPGDHVIRAVEDLRAILL